MYLMRSLRTARWRHCTVGENVSSFQTCLSPQTPVTGSRPVRFAKRYQCTGEIGAKGQAKEDRTMVQKCVRCSNTLLEKICAHCKQQFNHVFSVQQTNNLGKPECLEPKLKTEMTETAVKNVKSVNIETNKITLSTASVSKVNFKELSSEISTKVRAKTAVDKICVAALSKRTNLLKSGTIAPTAGQLNLSPKRNYSTVPSNTKHMVNVIPPAKKKITCPRCDAESWFNRTKVSLVNPNWTPPLLGFKTHGQKQNKKKWNDVTSRTNSSIINIQTCPRCELSGIPNCFSSNSVRSYLSKTSKGVTCTRSPLCSRIASFATTDVITSNNISDQTKNLDTVSGVRSASSDTCLGTGMVPTSPWIYDVICIKCYNFYDPSASTICDRCERPFSKFPPNYPPTPQNPLPFARLQAKKSEKKTGQIKLLQTSFASCLDRCAVVLESWQGKQQLRPTKSCSDLTAPPRDWIKRKVKPWDYDYDIVCVKCHSYFDDNSLTLCNRCDRPVSKYPRENELLFNATRNDPNTPLSRMQGVVVVSHDAKFKKRNAHQQNVTQNQPTLEKATTRQGDNLKTLISSETVNNCNERKKPLFRQRGTGMIGQQAPKTAVDEICVTAMSKRPMTITCSQCEVTAPATVLSTLSSRKSESKKSTFFSGLFPKS